DFRGKYNIPGEKRILCVLPGSRMSEIRKLAPVFEQTIARVGCGIENLSVVVPVVPHTRAAVRARVAGWPIKPILVEDESDKIAAFSAANAALAASGTATLELGMAGLPSVVAYKMGGMMGPLLLRMLRVPSAVIVNLVLDAPVMQEFLEDRCTADLITPAVNALLQDDALNSEKRAQLLPLANVLGGAGQSPATRAAEIIRSLIQQA
ncbi:MAG: lipid-A-disaccharide synthase, partial [Pseudomonadota bacterium]|nr:lipid-A-disaccharide synthase [Pseudomonadota bacterium]